MQHDPVDVTRDCLSLASKVLSLDICEIWLSKVHDEPRSFECAYIQVAPELMRKFPGMLSGPCTASTLDHKISPGLCEQARSSASRIHWDVRSEIDSSMSQSGSLNSAITELSIDTGQSSYESKSLNKNMCPTQIAYCLGASEVDDDLEVYLVGFATKSVEFQEQNVKVLEGLVYILKIAAQNGLRDADQNDRDLDGKGALTPTKRTSSNRDLIVGDITIALEDGKKSSILPSWEPERSFNFPVRVIPASGTILSNLSLPVSFKDIQHIADGSNSNIFSAKYNGQMVAIKMLKQNLVEDKVAMNEFMVEHGLLVRMNHPNIIKVLGAGSEPRLFIALEYLEGGTLSKMLAVNDQTDQRKGIVSKLFRKETFTFINLLHRIRELADAFNYIHTSVCEGAVVIHRDVKPDNIGFTKDGQMKIFDFGLCTCVKQRQNADDKYEMTGRTGSLRYMAPEVALNQPYTEKVDIYSFGILVWQMARDRVPFKGWSKDDFLKVIIGKGRRPKLDSSWPANFSELLEECWHVDQLKRPAFADIIVKVDRLIDEEYMRLNAPSLTKKIFSPSSKSKLKRQVVGARETSWF